MSFSSIVHPTPAIIINTFNTSSSSSSGVTINLSMEEKLEKWKAEKKTQHRTSNTIKIQGSNQTKVITKITSNKKGTTFNSRLISKPRPPLTPLTEQQTLPPPPDSLSGAKRDHILTKAKKELIDTVEKPPAKKGRIKSTSKPIITSTIKPHNIQSVQTISTSTSITPATNPSTILINDSLSIDRIKSTGSAPSSPKLIRCLSAELGSPVMNSSCSSSNFHSTSPLAALLPSSLPVTPSTPLPGMQLADSTPNTSVQIAPPDEKTDEIIKQENIVDEGNTSIHMVSPHRLRSSLSSQSDSEMGSNSPTSIFDTASLINSPVISFTPSLSMQNLTGPPMLELAVKQELPSTPNNNHRMTPTANRTPGHRRMLTPRSCGIAKTPGRIVIAAPLPSIKEAENVLQPENSTNISAIAPASSTSVATLIPAPKAQSTVNATVPTESSVESSFYVYAEVRAHPSIQKKLGTPTFLSPVRRSARLATTGTLVRVDGERNEEVWKNMLEKTGYAFYPNNKLMQAVEEEKEVPTVQVKKNDSAVSIDIKMNQLSLNDTNMDSKDDNNDRVSKHYDVTQEELDRLSMPPPLPRSPKNQNKITQSSSPTSTHNKVVRRERTPIPKGRITPILRKSDKHEEKEGKKEPSISSTLTRTYPTSLPIPSSIAAPAASFNGIRRNSTPRPLTSVKSRIANLSVPSTITPTRLTDTEIKKGNTPVNNGNSAGKNVRKSSKGSSLSSNGC